MLKDEKKAVIASAQRHQKDTGSYEVQITILTKRILELTEHLRANPKDKHSRRGLLGMVAKRRKLLKNLKEESLERYESILQKLELRK